MSAYEYKIAASEIWQNMKSDDAFIEKVAGLIATKMQDMQKIGKYISKNTAYKRYGRKKIDEWLALELVGYRNNGKSHLFEFKALEELSNLSEKEYEQKKKEAINKFFENK